MDSMVKKSGHGRGEKAKNFIMGCMRPMILCTSKLMSVRVNAKIVQLFLTGNFRQNVFFGTVRSKDYPLHREPGKTNVLAWSKPGSKTRVPWHLNQTFTRLESVRCKSLVDPRIPGKSGKPLYQG